MNLGMPRGGREKSSGRKRRRNGVKSGKTGRVKMVTSMMRTISCFKTTKSDRENSSN